MDGFSERFPSVLPDFCPCPAFEKDLVVSSYVSAYVLSTTVGFLVEQLI